MSDVTNISAAQTLLGKAVFLLGAGATRDAGCYISNEMLQDIYEMSLEQPEKSALDFLLSSLQYHASWKNLKEGPGFNPTIGHQPNIEDLMLLIRRIVNRDSYLPFPITGSWADKINFLEIEWRATKTYAGLGIKQSLFEYLEIKIASRLPNWLNLGKEDTDYLVPIDDYFRESKQEVEPLKIFTLNYDLVFEKHFNSNDETLLNTGFSNGTYVGFSQSLPIQNVRINYYKLHGSIDWTKTEAGLIREYGSVVKDEVNDFNSSNGEMIQMVVGDLDSNPTSNPHIIFGQGGKFLSVEPFMNLLYEFKQQLQRVQVIFVVGYSFFDPYINNLLLEGLALESENPKLMVIVNPQFSEDTHSAMSNAEIESEQKRRFIDYIKLVQKSTYLSELPGFNLTEISPNKIKMESLKAKDFFEKYFSPKKNGFAELYNELQKIGSEGDVF